MNEGLAAGGRIGQERPKSCRIVIPCELYTAHETKSSASMEDLVYGVVGYPKYTYLSYGYNSIQLLHGLNQIRKIYSR